MVDNGEPKPKLPRQPGKLPPFAGIAHAARNLLQQPGPRRSPSQVENSPSRAEQFLATRAAIKEPTYGHEVVDHNYPSRFLEDFGFSEGWQNFDLRRPLLNIYYNHRAGDDISRYVETHFADPNDPEDTRPNLPEESREIFKGYIAYLLQKPTEAIPTITEEDLEAALAGEPFSPSREASHHDMEELTAAIKSDLRNNSTAENNYQISFELEQRLGLFDFTDEQIELLAGLIDVERHALGAVDRRRH